MAMKWVSKQKGFTIVELLIVIVVIAILAAITIVAYNGITNRAKTSAVQNAVAQATKKVLAYAVSNADDYPINLSDAELVEPGNVTYQYMRLNTTLPRTFCVSATTDTISYYATSANTSPQTGTCPGYTNLVAWDKTQPTVNPPILSNANVDPAVFRKSTASMRISAGSAGQTIRGFPTAVSTGQIYNISLWIKTDSNWDGQSANSKIRFGNQTSGSMLVSCPLNGVKTVWTQVSCEINVPAGVTSLVASVGNDGTTGSIWIDDLTVLKLN